MRYDATESHFENIEPTSKGLETTPRVPSVAIVRLISVKDMSEPKVASRSKTVVEVVIAASDTFSYVHLSIHPISDLSTHAHTHVHD